jgi:hypothetical protein
MTPEFDSGEPAGVLTSEAQAEAALDLMHGIALALIGPPEDEDDPEAEELVEAEIDEARGTRPQSYGAGAGQPATVIRLSVEPSEMEQIVGRQGRTAHSLRVILNAVGVRHGRRYMLEIVELPEFDEEEDPSEAGGTDSDL